VANLTPSIVAFLFSPDMDSILQILTLDNIIEALGFIVGIIYLYFEYHADARVWIASIIMPTISLWVYFRAGLYADFGIDIYYLIIAIYGYYAWTHGITRKKEQAKELPITHMPLSRYLPITIVFAAIYFALVWVLINFTNSNVPWLDSLNTSLSIIAMWMLARKYIEQWLVWFVVDAICVGLDIYKGIYFYATLYTIYTVIALIGYRKWLRLMHSQEPVKD
jgi:nicotinamide mononucleotide transporter